MRRRTLPYLHRIARTAAAVLALALLPGCASLIDRIVDAKIGEYFHDAGPPPAAPLQYELARLPFSEYWAGIVFNGEKIGFSHLSIRPRPEDGRYVIASEASFLLRFLGIEKKVKLTARDVVNSDLTLFEFSYDYNIDGSALLISGRGEAGALNVEIVAGGKPNAQRLKVPGKLYPSSAIMLYPVLHGIALGRDHAFQVYSGQLQTLAEVTQRVHAYEKSNFLPRSAFRLETTLHGQRAVTWIDETGRPVFEIGGSGVMISALEDEARAKRYLALASLNKNEGLIEYSLIRPEAPIVEPRRASAVRLTLEGVPRLPPLDEWQRCEKSGEAIECEIRSPPAADAKPAAERASGVPAKYLEPSITVQSNDPSIRATATEIAGPAATPAGKIARILDWLRKNIERAPLDVFSALDVLEKRKAECQGHAYLYAALARAAGIPTRIVSGLAYSEDFDGFLYHSWAESWDGARWRPVDPTFGQAAADATHVKLVEGEALADLLPLLDWVGKLKIRVLAVEH
jgi:hypothetical protein